MKKALSYLMLFISCVIAEAEVSPFYEIVDGQQFFAFSSSGSIITWKPPANSQSTEKAPFWEKEDAAELQNLTAHTICCSGTIRNARYLTTTNAKLIVVVRNGRIELKDLDGIEKTVTLKQDDGGVNPRASLFSGKVLILDGRYSPGVRGVDNDEAIYFKSGGRQKDTFFCGKDLNDKAIYLYRHNNRKNSSKVFRIDFEEYLDTGEYTEEKPLFEIDDRIAGCVVAGNSSEPNSQVIVKTTSQPKLFLIDTSSGGKRYLDLGLGNNYNVRSSNSTHVLKVYKSSGGTPPTQTDLLYDFENNTLLGFDKDAVKPPGGRFRGTVSGDGSLYSDLIRNVYRTSEITKKISTPTISGHN